MKCFSIQLFIYFIFLSIYDIRRSTMVQPFCWNHCSIHQINNPAWIWVGCWFPWWITTWMRMAKSDDLMFLDKLLRQDRVLFLLNVWTTSCGFQPVHFPINLFTWIVTSTCLLPRFSVHILVSVLIILVRHPILVWD